MPVLHKVLLALGVLFVVCVATPSIKADPSQCDALPGNLVLNCGFESGSFGPWINSGNTSISGVAIGGPSTHTGNNGAFFGPINTLGFLTQNIATIPGATYRLSFYLANGGGPPNEFQVSFNGVQLLSQINSTAFAYSLFSFDNLLADSESAQLQFAFSQNPSHLFLDDVDLFLIRDRSATVPEPVSMILLGSGIVGLGIRLRKSRKA